MKSKLSLKKETLTELTPDSLRMVQGGAVASDSCTSCACSCVRYSCQSPVTLVTIVTDYIKDGANVNLNAC